MSKVLIQCVVVLYKCSLAKSNTLQSLAEFSHIRNDLARQMALLIYDNSQEPQSLDLTPWAFGIVEYHQASQNHGLAPAYNYALSAARQRGSEWLLLFDQDTSLQSAFIQLLFNAIEFQLPSEVCAILPKLVMKSKVISPQIVGRFNNQSAPLEFSGIYPKKITALNSAACLRSRAMDAIGGFPRKYWLDFLDHIVFHQLQEAGGKVLALDVELEHRLAFGNLEAEMDINRYSNVLAAEWNFVRDTGSRSSSFIHRLKLLKRMLYQSVKLHNKTYAVKTLRAIWQ